MKALNLVLDTDAATGDLYQAVVAAPICKRGHLVSSVIVNIRPNQKLGYKPWSYIGEDWWLDGSDEELFLTMSTRLYSSTGTHKYRLGEAAQEAPSFTGKSTKAIRVSKAPYRPKIFMVLRGWAIYIVPPGLEDDTIELLAHRFIFSQRCANRSIIIAGEPISLENEGVSCSLCMVEDAIDASGSATPILQGNLTLRKVDAEQIAPWWHWSVTKRLFNHKWGEYLSETTTLYRDGVAYKVIEVPEEDAPVVVSSTDHDDVEVGSGIWLLSHPIPEGDDD